jgi:hypothetical protein
MTSHYKLMFSSIYSLILTITHLDNLRGVPKCEMCQFSNRYPVGRNRDWHAFTNTWNTNMFAPLDVHTFPWRLPSHVTLGLCPHIPSFYLSRGGCRFLLLYLVVALMESLLRLIRASLVVSVFHPSRSKRVNRVNEFEQLSSHLQLGLPKRSH